MCDAIVKYYPLIKLPKQKIQRAKFKFLQKCIEHNISNIILHILKGKIGLLSKGKKINKNHTFLKISM